MEKRSEECIKKYAGFYELNLEDEDPADILD
jgi:hypothetical protein